MVAFVSESISFGKQNDLEGLKHLKLCKKLNYLDLSLILILKKINHMILYIVFTILFSCNQSQQPSNERIDIDVKKITYRNQSFDIVKIDLRTLPVKLYMTNAEGTKLRSLKKLKAFVESQNKELLFGMNGGMYQKDGTPQGLYIEKGKTIRKTNKVEDAYGNFYLQPNGIFLLNEDTAAVMTTKDYLQKNPVVNYATQSGPMLVIDNQIHAAFREGSKNVHIRNGVGILSKHEVIFVISNEVVNLYDFAMLFKEELNCKNALYLDGFVSRAYIPKLEREELTGYFGVMIAIEK